MKRQYEGMFLFDPAFAGDFKNAEDEVRRIMERAEADLLMCRRWDERKLAYEIRGRKRGVYVLTYFSADPSKIKPMERDAQLSERILRLLVLRADGVTQERMDFFAPPPKEAEPEPEPTAEAPPETELKAEPSEEVTPAPEPEPALQEQPDAQGEREPKTVIGAVEADDDPSADTEANI
ncbi:MAG: 30S ribosomal protein S6 [Phycisphaerales bacterium]|nr:MAG: 30S ribosomal protein S6 [Phycisphaerales bacterium]